MELVPKAPLGWCPDCRLPFAVKKDGTMYRHGWHRSRRKRKGKHRHHMPCTGSGKKAMTEEERNAQS